MVGESDLECGIDGFRARVGKERMIDVAWHVSNQPARQFKGQGMAHLERGREVQLTHLLGHGLVDTLAAVTEVDAPKTRGAVEDATTVRGGEMHVFRGYQQAWTRLELPVGGERHPEGVKVSVLHCGSGHRILATVGSPERKRPAPL